MFRTPRAGRRRATSPTSAPTICASKGVAYRLVYTIEADVVVFVSNGPHDTAYARARRRWSLLRTWVLQCKRLMLGPHWDPPDDLRSNLEGYRAVGIGLDQ